MGCQLERKKLCKLQQHPVGTMTASCGARLSFRSPHWPCCDESEASSTTIPSTLKRIVFDLFSCNIEGRLQTPLALAVYNLINLSRPYSARRFSRPNPARNSSTTKLLHKIHNSNNNNQAPYNSLRAKSTAIGSACSWTCRASTNSKSTSRAQAHTGRTVSRK